MRVVSGSSDGKPNPASSVLKLRGSHCSRRPPNCSSTSPARIRCRSTPATTSPRRGGRNAARPYLNYRKISIYGGSNEVQRTIIASTILGL